jgi:DNA-binding XRE family transcriptional regulator
MATSVIKGLPALLGDARRALSMNQEQFAAAIGSSKRTVQRLETGHSSLYGGTHARIAALVHPHDAALAAEFARLGGQTLEGLGLAATAATPAQSLVSPPAAPPSIPRHLAVDSVVCVASDAAQALPGAVRGVLLAAFRRARELGLSGEEVERALEAAVKPAVVEGGKGKR